MKRRSEEPRIVNIPIESDDDPSPRSGTTPGDTAPAEGPGGDAVADDIAASTKDLEEALDHLKRLQAEFDNYRRRTTRERAETADYAQARLVERMLPTVDDLDRACDAIPETERDASLLRGFLLVRDKLHQILAESGLERVSAVGEDFDPERHEALLTEPVDADRAGKVLDEFVAGYAFKGKVIRPTRVKVGVDSPGD